MPQAGIGVPKYVITYMRAHHAPALVKMFDMNAGAICTRYLTLYIYTVGDGHCAPESCWDAAIDVLPLANLKKISFP